MRRFKTLGAAVVAACVLGTGFASLAAARLPEWGECQLEPSSHGKYQDAGCLTKAPRRHGVGTGGYEWAPLNKLVLSGPRETPEEMKLIGKITFETAAGKKIECPTATVNTKVQLTGPQAAITPQWEFRECSSEGQSCGNEHAPTIDEIDNRFAWREEAPTEENAAGEEVPVGPAPGWKGHLGFVTGGATPTVGVDYTVLNDERLFEPTRCLGPIGTVWIGGGKHGNNGFIGTLAPVNQMTSTFTETYRESAPGIQEPTRLGPRRSVLEAFIANHWEPIAITATFQYGFEGGRQLEIKAR
jgi:hypothetical protein